MSIKNMSNTGNDDFDRYRNKFSATIRGIESSMHERAARSGDHSHDDRSVSQSIRKASSILANMSSIVKDVADDEEPALKQELLDIYKACKMQLKTYKMLHTQTDLFQDTNATATETNEEKTSDRDVLFGAIAATDDSSGYNKTGGGSSRANNIRDQITSNTQGRLREQNSRLQDALRSIRESDEVAQEISGELVNQRETLQTAQGRLHQFSSMTEYSNNLLNSMNKPWWRKWWRRSVK